MYIFVTYKMLQISSVLFFFKQYFRKGNSKVKKQLNCLFISIIIYHSSKFNGTNRLILLRSVQRLLIVLDVVAQDRKINMLISIGLHRISE